MAIRIDEIEDGILARLNSAPISGYARTIATYQGDLEGEISQLVLQFPAILVQFQAAEYASRVVTGKVREIEFSWLIFACERNLRGNAAARRGAAGSVGVYTILDDMRALLNNHKLAGAALATLHPLRLVREAALMNERDIAIYAAEYGTGYLL